MKALSITDQKLTRARTQLLLNQPFFGTLCLRLKLVPGDLPTMATDGRRIVYGPEFVDILTPVELEAVLAHEVLHCALGHHCRRGERDPRLWNQAADLAINPILLNNGFILPDGALIDHALDNLSAEEIYARLTQRSDHESASAAEPMQQAAGSGVGAGSEQEHQNHETFDTGSGRQSQSSFNQETTGSNAIRQSPHPGGFGEVWDATDEHGAPASQAENSRQLHEWNIAADQALRSASSCGRGPANLDRPLNEIRQSRQDWRAILRDFVAATIASDYCWMPPNRRYLAAGLYLPAVKRTGLGTIVVGVDTSGSIAEEELKQFAGEISAIADEAEPEAIYVVYCDAAVQSFQEFDASEPIHLAPKGGGGTDFRPVFEWVQEKRSRRSV